MWVFEGVNFKSIEDFPEEVYGFIYKIKNLSNGKIYIGKKVLFFNRKMKLGKKELKELQGSKGRPIKFKQNRKESDWKTYCGSHKGLLKDIEKGDDIIKTIISVHYTKKQLTYFENKALFSNSVIEYPEQYYNDSIQGRFFYRDIIL